MHQKDAPRNKANFISFKINITPVRKITNIKYEYTVPKNADVFKIKAKRKYQGFTKLGI